MSTFDHNDLNAYLLVVIGLAHPADDHVALYDSLVKKAQANESVPLKDIQVSDQPSSCTYQTGFVKSQHGELKRDIEHP